MVGIRRFNFNADGIAHNIVVIDAILSARPPAADPDFRILIDVVAI